MHFQTNNQTEYDKNQSECQWRATKDTNTMFGDYQSHLGTQIAKFKQQK